MYKKRKLILVLLIIISMLYYPQFAHGAIECNLFWFESDKEFYYYYETVELNASWYLINDEGNYAYIQISIVDDFNNSLWNSTKFEDLGLVEWSWSIPIQSLNISFLTNPSILYLHFVFHSEPLAGSMTHAYLETIIIRVAKNDVICELFGYKNYLRYGDRLNLSARFYFASNYTILDNYNISVEIDTDFGKIYNQNFITNQQGILELNFSSDRDFIIGENRLILEIINNRYLNNSIFQYIFTVNRTQVIVDVIKFDKQFFLDKMIEIELALSYINQTVIPLKEKEIIVYIYENTVLKFENLIKTTQFGYLNISIKPGELNLDGKDTDLDLIINFQGTDLIEDATFSFVLKIAYQDNPLLQVIIFSNIIFFSILGSFLYLRHRNKKIKYKVVKDIYFKF